MTSWFAATQARTTETARRHCAIWTSSDLELLTEFWDEPNEELAVTLGRTYAAVVDMKHAVATGTFQLSSQVRVYEAEVARHRDSLCPVHFVERSLTGVCSFCR